jgi:hypothetical protein
VSPPTSDQHRSDDDGGDAGPDPGRSATAPEPPAAPTPPTAPEPPALAPPPAGPAYQGPAFGPVFGPVASPRRPGRALAGAAGVVLVIVALGAPLGLLWSALAPALPLVKQEDGATAVQPAPEELIAADGWFSLLGLGFGLLVAIAIWLLLRRYRGPVGLIAVGLGGIGAAVVAWRVGRQIGLDAYQRALESAPVGTLFTKPPDLRAGGFEWLFGFVPVVRGNLLLPAFGAIMMYTLLAGWSRWPSLRPEPELPVSWDWPAPPAPPAAPAPPGSGAAEPPRG